MPSWGERKTNRRSRGARGSRAQPPAWLFWGVWCAIVALSTLALLFTILAGPGLGRAGAGGLGVALMSLLCGAASVYIMVTIASGKLNPYRVYPSQVSLDAPLIHMHAVRHPVHKEYHYVEAARYVAVGTGFTALVLLGMSLSRLASHLSNPFLAKCLTGWVALFVLHPFLMALLVFLSV